MKIIGIGHRKGVGKDTFAGMLKGALPSVYDIYQGSFATALKYHAQALFMQYGLQSDGYYDEHRDEKESPIDGLPESPREIYVAFGLFMRSFDPDYWVKALLDDVPTCFEYLIIPDVRFPNEAKLIKERGGYLINVTNPNVPDTDDAADCALVGYDGWDTTIVNDGTLEELRENAECVARMGGV